MHSTAVFWMYVVKNVSFLKWWTVFEQDSSWLLPSEGPEVFHRWWQPKAWSCRLEKMFPFVGQQWRRRHKQTCGHGGRRGHEEWREQHENKDVTTCKVDSQWEFAIWLRELKLWPCDNLEGWEMGGRGHVCTYGWFMLMYGRNQHNTVKQVSFN